VLAIPAAAAEDLALIAAELPEIAPHEARANTAKAPEVAPREKMRTIRCWQYGRLILEEAVLGKVKIQGDTYLLKRPNDQEDLQLIDLRSGGACIIS
jgi:hypothetical protein